MEMNIQYSKFPSSQPGVSRLVLLHKDEQTQV